MSNPRFENSTQKRGKILLPHEKRNLRHMFQHTLAEDIAMRKMANKLGISISDLIVRSLNYFIAAHSGPVGKTPEPLPDPPPPEPLGPPRCPRCNGPLSLNLRESVLQREDMWDCVDEYCKWQGKTRHTIPNHMRKPHGA